MATIFTDPDTKKPLETQTKGNGMWGDAVTKFGPGLTGGHPWTPESPKNASNASGGTWEASLTIAPSPGQPEPEKAYPCDHPGCAAVAKSKAGLGAHKRSHK